MKCSFCWEEKERVVVADNKVVICHDCVKIAMEIIENAKKEKPLGL